MVRSWSQMVLKAMPLLDQCAVALFNFSFVLVTSLLLPTRQFVFANYGFLTILFVLNVANALAFQPYLRMTSRHGLANMRNTILYAASLCAVISVVTGPLVYAVGKGLGLPDEAIYTTVLILYASMIYELGRRTNMLRGAWGINLFYGAALIVLMLLTMLAVRPDTALGALAVVLVVYAVLGAPILLFGVGGVLRSSAVLHTTGIGHSIAYRESLRYGALLLGGAVAFWFMSGGYLLVVAEFLSAHDVAALRSTQNLMNGMLLILTTVDNYILSGQAHRLLERPASVYGSLISAVFIYSALAYVAFVLIYPGMRSVAYLIAVWAAVYLLTAFTRLWTSILKWHGDAWSVLAGQTGGVLSFGVLISVATSLGLQIDADGVTLFWLLSSAVIFVLVLSSMRGLPREGQERSSL